MDLTQDTFNLLNATLNRTRGTANRWLITHGVDLRNEIRAVSNHILGVRDYLAGTEPLSQKWRRSLQLSVAEEHLRAANRHLGQFIVLEIAAEPNMASSKWANRRLLSEGFKPPTSYDATQVVTTMIYCLLLLMFIAGAVVVASELATTRQTLARLMRRHEEHYLRFAEFSGHVHQSLQTLKSMQHRQRDGRALENTMTQLQAQNHQRQHRLISGLRQDVTTLTNKLEAAEKEARQLRARAYTNECIPYLLGAQGSTPRERLRNAVLGNVRLPMADPRRIQELLGVPSPTGFCLTPHVFDQFISVYLPGTNILGDQDFLAKLQVSFHVPRETWREIMRERDSDATSDDLPSLATDTQTSTRPPTSLSVGPRTTPTMTSESRSADISSFSRELSSDHFSGTVFARNNTVERGEEEEQLPTYEQAMRTSTTPRGWTSGRRSRTVTDL